MKDLCLINFTKLEAMIFAENVHQLSKWGIQDHTPFEWLTDTTEELGELAKAISEHHYRGGPASEVVKEAIQVVTLAIKIAEMYLHEEEIKP